MGNLFIICVGGSYGAEDYYLVDDVTIEQARVKANTKYAEVSEKFSGTSLQDLEIIFDDEGVSQLITNMW